MKSQIVLLTFAFFFTFFTANAQQALQGEKLDNRIDNQGYWRKAAEKGLTLPNPHVTVAPATFTGSRILAVSVINDDSPDIVLIEGSTTQSENSVFINPNDTDNPLNSNNSTSLPEGGITLYGANKLYSFDAGETWDGGVQGAGGSNSGDPVALIGLNGRYYIGFINNAMGQTVAYSDDQGATWATSVVANAPSGWSGILDKNHMWVDNSTSSPHEGSLYNAWTAFGGSNNNNIEISSSTDHAETWSAPVNISGSLYPGSHAQGVNIQTGPEGEVYAAFSIYDGWPTDEGAIGLARSFDGGQTYTSTRIINNIRGIRNSGTGKNMRVNSFPVMAVDISNSTNRGNIYLVWSNIGYPGTNTGSDIDVYMIRSTDGGETWTEPIRVNQDPPDLGKQHYFPWITCDPVSGALSVIFYDDRNVSSSQCEVFCANSYDGGDTWEDFKVSDVSFTPSPIPGLATGYFGDYIGIAARNGMVYPVWTDNRTGTTLTYVSPYRTSMMEAPTDLLAQLDEETGEVNLTWHHETSPTFNYYKIYRNFDFLGTSALPVFNDILPAYGLYRYYVTAFYEYEGESGPAITDVQWGNALAQVDPPAAEGYVSPESFITVAIDLTNAGQLPLHYTSKFEIPDGGNTDNREYCFASGGCGEYIKRVSFNEINNYSDCDGYSDFTHLGITLSAGESFQITVYNGTNIYPTDVCGIWIDWNQNENLLDDAPVTVTGSPGPGPYTATIIIPPDAKSGNTRMRIRIKRGSPVSPCGITPDGEVEDYSLNVIGWVSASPRNGTLAPEETQPITFTLNATNEEVGSYQANFVINSNDPVNSEIVVPVIMHVTDINLTVSADSDSICLGGSTVLHALANGGSGSFIYSWTSDPEGFTSVDPDPMVTPEVTTTYYVELSDGFMTLYDEITIVVLDLPVVNLGPDIAVCDGEEAVLDAGSGLASYLWSDGQTGQTITVSIPGEYWVEVSNEFGCINRDTLVFSVNPLPVVSLEEDQAFCEGTSVMLTAGAGYNSYLWSTGDNSYYINVMEPGEYWVMVTDANGCMGQDTIMLTMDPLPLAPESVSGPVSVDNFQNPATNFTCTAGMHADAYEWGLQPAEAGIITWEGTTATVTWMAGFTGTASISVKSLNDCGGSAFSPAHEVAVYSSQGISDRKAISGIRLFPNPNDGNFTLQLHSDKEQEILIRITTTGGVRILENREALTAGPFQTTFNLSNLPAGSYNLQILDKNNRMISRQQVVVQ